MSTAVHFRRNESERVRCEYPRLLRSLESKRAEILRLEEEVRELEVVIAHAEVILGNYSTQHNP